MSSIPIEAKLQQTGRFPEIATNEIFVDLTALQTAFPTNLRYEGMRCKIWSDVQKTKILYYIVKSDEGSFILDDASNATISVNEYFTELLSIDNGSNQFELKYTFDENRSQEAMLFWNSANYPKATKGWYINESNEIILEEILADKLNRNTDQLLFGYYTTDEIVDEPDVIATFKSLQAKQINNLKEEAKAEATAIYLKDLALRHTNDGDPKIHSCFGDRERGSSGIINDSESDGFAFDSASKSYISSKVNAKLKCNVMISCKGLKKIFSAVNTVGSEDDIQINLSTTGGEDSALSVPTSPGFIDVLMLSSDNDIQLAVSDYGYIGLSVDGGNTWANLSKNLGIGLNTWRTLACSDGTTEFGKVLIGGQNAAGNGVTLFLHLNSSHEVINVETPYMVFAGVVVKVFYDGGENFIVVSGSVTGNLSSPNFLIKYDSLNNISETILSSSLITEMSMTLTDFDPYVGVSSREIRHYEWKDFLFIRGRKWIGYHEKGTSKWKFIKASVNLPLNTHVFCCDVSGYLERMYISRPISDTGSVYLLDVPVSAYTVSSDSDIEYKTGVDLSLSSALSKYTMPGMYASMVAFFDDSKNLFQSKSKKIKKFAYDADVTLVAETESATDRFSESYTNNTFSSYHKNYQYLGSPASYSGIILDQNQITSIDTYDDVTTNGANFDLDNQAMVIKETNESLSIYFKTETHEFLVTGSNYTVIDQSGIEQEKSIGLNVANLTAPREVYSWYDVQRYGDYFVFFKQRNINNVNIDIFYTKNGSDTINWYKMSDYSWGFGGSIQADFIDISKLGIAANLIDITFDNDENLLTGRCVGFYEKSNGKYRIDEFTIDFVTKQFSHVVELRPAFEFTWSEATYFSPYGKKILNQADSYFFVPSVFNSKLELIRDNEGSWTLTIFSGGEIHRTDYLFHDNKLYRSNGLTVRMIDPSDYSQLTSLSVTFAIQRLALYLDQVDESYYLAAASGDYEIYKIAIDTTPSLESLILDTTKYLPSMKFHTFYQRPSDKLIIYSGTGSIIGIFSFDGVAATGLTKLPNPNWAQVIDPSASEDKIYNVTMEVIALKAGVKVKSIMAQVDAEDAISIWATDRVNIFPYFVDFLSSDFAFGILTISLSKDITIDEKRIVQIREKITASKYKQRSDIDIEIDYADDEIEIDVGSGNEFDGRLVIFE